MTLTDLAERVTLSVSRRQRRVRALEDAGVLRGYRAVVDAAALGLRFEVPAFVTLGRPEAKDFDTALADAPQIIEAQRLFGESDYLIRVVTADLPAYQKLYGTVLVRLPGVSGLTSIRIASSVRTSAISSSSLTRPVPARITYTSSARPCR
jgi:DNA-binding Lrp family transcriptional regulator